jgi:hypothetical protein
MVATPRRLHDRAMTRLHWIGIGVLVAQQIAVISMLPESPFHALGEPTNIAAIAGTAATLFLLVSRFTARRGDRERLVLALFLAGMPIVYVWAAVLHGDHGALVVESVGIPLYGGLAIAGYVRAPWLLGVGIIAHGLAWDAWHHGHSGYIPDWYSAGCLISDIGVGIYALIHARRLAPQVSIVKAAYG